MRCRDAKGDIYSLGIIEATTDGAHDEVDVSAD